MVAVPCLRDFKAARWKGHAPQNTTMLARAKHHHCQKLNWSAGIIENRTTGRASQNEPQNRLLRLATSSSPAISAADRSSPSGSPITTGGLGGPGGSASYPVSCTVLRSSSRVMESANWTRAVSVA